MATPVVLDTDIGTDIDDTSVLLQLLACPELDLKLVVTTGGDTEYRARLVAKLLETVGRTDIPIALGQKGEGYAEFQAEWVAGYSLETYKGTIEEDSVEAYRSLAAAHPQLTVISIGPATNVARLVGSAPELIPGFRFVGMHGSINIGYGGTPPAIPEANVKADVQALQTVLAAPWADRLLTPLDTCGVIVLDGERYQRLRSLGSQASTALFENYEIWAGNVSWDPSASDYMLHRSSTLFDTVAIYLAYDEDMVQVETHPITVTADGMTVIDPKGTPVRLALSWNDLPGFLDDLVQRVARLQ